MKKKKRLGFLDSILSKEVTDTLKTAVYAAGGDYLADMALDVVSSQLVKSKAIAKPLSQNWRGGLKIGFGVGLLVLGPKLAGNKATVQAALSALALGPMVTGVLTIGRSLVAGATEMEGLGDLIVRQRPAPYLPAPSIQSTGMGDFMATQNGRIVGESPTLGRIGNVGLRAA